jgi:hypothetical protein
MSTPHKAGRAKPVTLAKSASGKPQPAAASKAVKTEAAKTEAAKTEAAKTEAAKTETTKVEADKTAPAKPLKAKPETAKSTDPVTPDAIIVPAAPDNVMPAAWNELVKAQSEAALAWWQDAKDARTFADALAVNARHSRVQFEIVAGQAREMATYFQKAFESNNERLRSLFDQPKP